MNEKKIAIGVVSVAVVLGIVLGSREYNQKAQNSNQENQTQVQSTAADLYSIAGTVKEVSGNSLIIEVAVPGKIEGGAPVHRDLKLNFSGNIAVTKIRTQGGTTEVIGTSFSDVKTSAQIVAYTFSDPNKSNELTAAKLHIK
jgi:hypothetical protein